jgi:hypothetical protein
MTDYSKGKIYKIVSDSTDKMYIGSTTQLLCQRYGDHKKSYNKFLSGEYHFVSSFEILDKGDSQIFLIEKYPCSSNEELLSRERHWIEQFKDKVVNRYLPIRTNEEIKEIKNKQLRERRAANPEQFRMYDKKRYNKTREHRVEYQKKYYEDNKESVKECRKKYLENNKEKVNGHKASKIECACSCVITRSNLGVHLKTKKHQYFEETMKEFNRLSSIIY